MPNKYARALTADLSRLVSRLGPDTAATVAFASAVIPQGFASLGIRPRNQVFNTFRGTTISRPGIGTYAVGFTYQDLKAGQTDEDIYVLEIEKRILTYYPKGSYGKVNPDYAGTHRGQKDYLPPTADPLE